MAIGTSHTALCYFCKDSFLRFASCDEDPYVGTFGSSDVVKFKNQHIGFTAVYARMFFQKLNNSFANFLPSN